MENVSAPISGRKYSRLSVQWEKVAFVSTSVVAVFLIAVPLAMLLFSSVRATENKLPFEATDFTLTNYARVLTSEVTYRLFANTLLYAVGALIISISLATVFAWFLERGRTPFRPLLILLVLAPMSTPPMVAAMGWSQLANPANGLLNTTIRSILGISGLGPFDVYSIAGMALVTGFGLVPSAYIMLSGPISRLDPSMEEASFTSGVSPLSTFRRITFSLLRPATLAAVIYFFVLILEAFETAAVLGMPRQIYVFSTLIYQAVHPPRGLPDFGMASAYAIVVLLISGILIYLYGSAVRRREAFAVVTGKAYRPKLYDFGPWKYLLIALIVVFFLFSVVLPILMLIWTSLGLTYRTEGLASLAFASFKEYSGLNSDGRLGRAITNTAIIATAAATATMLLASIISWMSSRSNSRWATLPDRLTFLVVATPAVVIALALAFFYLWVPIPVYGTIWIIVIALTTRYMAYTTRLMGAAYLQIHKELEEASHMSGVAWLLTMRRIDFPLIWPSLARGWLWVFVNSLRDATVALMLFTVANDTIGVRLWLLWMGDTNYPKASALAVCLAIASMIFSFFVARQTAVQGDKS